MAVVTVGSSGVGNQGYFWKLSPFPLPVASWQCQIRSETEIAPVEFSIEMNTYRVVTQVIEKAKKELLGVTQAAASGAPASVLGDRDDTPDDHSVETRRNCHSTSALVSMPTRPARTSVVRKAACRPLPLLMG